MELERDEAEGMAVSEYTTLVYAPDTLPESYKPLVFSKWLRSLKYGNDYFKLIDQMAYFNAYHPFIEQLLTRSSVTLAVLKDSPDVVLGFAVKNGTTLHYVHVHKDARKRGIAKTLVGEFSVFTHITSSGMMFWTKTMPKAVFNPFEV